MEIVELKIAKIVYGKYPSVQSSEFISLQLFSVKQALQKYWEYDIDDHQISVNFKQTCGGMDYNILCKIMPGFEISNNEAEQRNMEPQVKTEGKLKQRDSVTDILFNIAVEHVI